MSDTQLITVAQLRLTARTGPGGAGIDGQLGMEYQTIDEFPSRRFWWDGARHVPFLDAGQADALMLRNPQFTFGSVNTPAPSALSLGTKIIDISTVTLAATVSTALGTSGNALSSGGKTLKVTGLGDATPKTDFSGFTPFTLVNSATGNKSICFEAFKPLAGAPTRIRLYFATTTGFTVFSYASITIYPGRHLYTIPLPLGSASTAWANGGAGVFGSPCVSIRAIQNDAAQYPSGYSYMGVGDYIEFGDIYVDPQQPRPRFIFDYDANGPELVYPGANATIGYDGVSRNHSFCSFLSTYGWCATAGVITGAVGNVAGTMAVRDWQMARDNFGAAIISHTHAHPGQTDVAGAVAGSGGYPLLGPYGFGLVGAVAQTAADSGLQFTPANDLTAIKADIDLSIAWLQKYGFPEGARHMMLSQGGCDQYVNAALEAYAFRSVRARVDNTTWCPNPLGYSTTPALSSGQFNDSLSPLINRKMVLQMDGAAVSLATMTAFINRVIYAGGIGSFYGHSLGASATTIANYKLCADLLMTYVQAGACDVVTAYSLGSA